MSKASNKAVGRSEEDKMSKTIVVLLALSFSGLAPNSAKAGEGVCSQQGLDRGCTTYQEWDQDHAAWWCTCPEPNPALLCGRDYAATFDNAGNWSCTWVGRR